jgi:hypothetical protein
MTPAAKQYAFGALVVLAILLVWYMHSHRAAEPTVKSGMAASPGGCPHSSSKSKSTPRARFTGPGEHPGPGEFGALADSYPYGNYAGHVDMYYPSYNYPSA